MTGGWQESFRLLVSLYETLAFLPGITVIGNVVEDSFFERFVGFVGSGRDFALGRWSLLERRYADSLRDFPVILRRGALETI